MAIPLIPESPAKSAIRLEELLDMSALEHLLVNFCDLVGVASAIIDTQGKVLAQARWQKACTDYHRAHAQSCARCIESDVDLSVKMQDQENYALYRCKNGLTDAASPIMIAGNHLANVFVGQFLLKKADPEFFAQQAKELGFDEAEYLKVISEVPVVEEARVPKILAVMRDLAQLVGTMGYQALQTRRIKENNEQRHRAILDSIGIGIYENNTQGEIVFHNHAFGEMLGFGEDELVGQRAHESTHHHYPDGRIFLSQDCPLLSAADKGKASLSNQFIWKKNGDVLPVDYFVSPLIRDGQRTGAVISFIDITERKKIEQNLIEEKTRLEQALAEVKETENFYNQVLDSAPDGIILMNARHQMVYVNTQVLAIYGYTKDEVLGQSIDFMVPSNIREWHGKMIQSLLDNPSAYAHAFNHRMVSGQRKDGTVFPVELNLSLIERDGETMACASVRDISRRREIEKRLEESEQRLTFALSGTNTGLWDWNMLTNEVYTNDTWSEMLGYQRQELDERYGNSLERWSALVHPDDLAPTIALINEHVEGHTKDYRAKIRMRTKQGDYCWLLVVGQIAARNQEGKPLRLIGTHTDITELINAENQLDQQLKFQNILFDGIPIPVYYRDENLRLVKVNKAFDEQLVVELGKTYTETNNHMSLDERLAVEAIYREVMATGVSYHGERRMSNKKGEMRDYTMLLTPYINEQNVTIGLIGCLSDITVIREAERAMAEARTQAESAAAAKSLFLANMSHEIRTPMNGVMGLAHLLRRTNLSTQQLDYVTKILASAEHQLGIINDILDYSKIEAGKMELEETDFRLDEVLANLANLFAFQCDKKGIELILNVPPTLPRLLRGDPLRLGQVFINLTGNALKFTQQGEIVVQVDVMAQNEQEVTLRFAVRDTGNGMTPEQCGRLFQAFSQANTSITREYGGTGLGLSISKALVEKMGGTISVNSAVGKGSEFYFTATLRIGDLASLTADFEDLQGKRALVVDDHELTATVISDILKAMHINADIVLEGAEALEKISTAERDEKGYDFVLLDWRMPQMDGIEVATRLSHYTPIKAVPQIIMISSSDSGELRQKLGDVEVADVLMKPINPSMLFESILRIYGQSVRINPKKEEDLDMSELQQIAGAAVLLVEDNEINRQVASELLLAINIQVDMAENGEIALSMLENRDYELILMDMQMPVMDGVTATRKIRETRTAQDLPIVALTANAIRSELDACLQAGMNDTLTKPINPRELYRKLLQWLSHKNRQPLDTAQSGAPKKEIPLPNIKGLDINAGLLHVLGKRELYARILKQFYDNQGDMVSTLSRALIDGDKVLAQRLAHTLKGIAGTIGAQELHQSAQHIEEAIKRDETINPTLLSQAQEKLSVLCDGLALYLPQITEESAPLLAESDFRAKRDTLIAQLKNQDGEAVDTYNELSASLKTKISAEHYSLINTAVEQFDFDTALSVLAQYD